MKKIILFLLVIVVLVFTIISFTFGIQAKDKIKDLGMKVDLLEQITAPPKVSVLSEELGISLTDAGSSISISKLVIEDVGYNTIVKLEVNNKSNQTKTYVISNRKAGHTQDNYTEVTIDSPYVVVPLTNMLTIDGNQKEVVSIFVSKSDNNPIYQDYESWISVKEVNDSKTQVQIELILRILIRH